MPYVIVHTQATEEAPEKWCIHKAEGEMVEGEPPSYDPEAIECFASEEEAQSAARAMLEREGMDDMEDASEPMDDVQAVRAYIGGNVKALGNGKVGGYLVLFGDPTKVDLHGEYFTKSTDYGNLSTSDVYYQHGLDSTLKKRVIGRGELTKDDVGVWIEAQLNLRDEYEKAIYNLVEAGKMGWSSGTAGHLIEREMKEQASYIKRWILGLDASITPTPAEPRTRVVSVKALPKIDLSAHVVTSGVDALKQLGDIVTQGLAISGDTVDDLTKHANESNLGVDEMSEETKNELQEQIKSLEAKLDSVIEKAPPVKSAGVYQVGETKLTMRELVQAAREGNIAKVKNAIKTQVEGIGPDGGYLIQEQEIPSTLPELNLTSEVGNLVNRINVTSPSGWTTMLDYTDATFTRGDSADNAYGSSAIRSEGGSYGAQSIKFDKRQFTVTDAISGLYQASREIQEDYPRLAQEIVRVINRTVANEEEWFILRGTGVGMPEGILNWAGVIEVTEGTDNTISLNDTTAMVARLINNAIRPAWLVHNYAYANMMTLELPNGGAAVTPDLTRPGAMMLWGYPIIKTQMLPAQGTTGYLALVDLGMYNLYQRGNLYVDYSPHYGFASGMDTWRFGKRIDGHMAYRNKVTLNDGTSTVSPVVVLKNKT